MKQFRIVGISSKSNLLVLDNENTPFQYPIEGFKINNDFSSRLSMSDLIGKKIDCTLNKNNTHIRYQNVQYLSEKIKIGALSVVKQQLDISKIYNAQQKKTLFGCNVEKKNEPIKNITENRKQLLKFLSTSKIFKLEILYLHQQIIVNYKTQNQNIIFPIKLKNINTFFECLPQHKFAQFIQKNRFIEVNIDRPIYNAVKKRFQVKGVISQQLQLQIVKNGWGTVNLAILSQTNPKICDQYMNLQSQARQNHIGIYNKSCQILNFIYAKNNFVGEVSDVIDGYIFELTKKSGGKAKIQLAFVRTPVGDQIGAFNSRQFSRKQLIGQEVNVYLHKDSGLNITGSLIRTKDSKDFETILIESGWGFVRQQFVNSILTIKLNQLEKRAKEKGKGLHSKDVGTHRPQDLTIPNNQKEQIYYYRRQQLQKKFTQNQVGVLQGMIDYTNYKIWLQQKNIILKVRLEGVQSHNINPLLEQVKKMKEQHKQFYQNKLKKRSVVVTIKKYNRDSNSFTGHVVIQGFASLQQYLIQQAFVYTDRQNGCPQSFKKQQEKAKKLQKRLWSNDLKKFEPVNQLDLLGNKFYAKFSWIQDGVTIYIQPQANYKTIDMINQKLSKNLKPFPKQKIVIGALVAAPYFDEYYRASILSVKGKKIKLSFIDWGNKQTVDENSLKQLPQQLHLIEKQCVKARLYMAKVIKNEEFKQKMRARLINGQQCSFKRETEDYISAYKDKIRNNQKQPSSFTGRNEGKSEKNRKQFEEKQSLNLGRQQRVRGGKQK